MDHSAEVYIKTVLLLLLLREHCRRELEKNSRDNAAIKEAWMPRGELLVLPDKRQLLELDAYGEEVEASGRGRRFRQFEDIKLRRSCGTRGWTAARRSRAAPTSKLTRCSPC